MNVKKLTVMSVLLAAALSVYIIEVQLPPIAPIPGVRMGLANVITLIAILWFGKKEAFLILTARIIIGSIFFGGMMNFAYSMAGGMVSFAVMAVLMKMFGKKGIWVVSVFGAIGHNVGQIIMAIAITSTWQIAAYLPVLLISAVITGAFTGFVASFADRKKNLFIKGDIK